MKGRCLIRLLQINLALSKQTKSSGWKFRQHFCFCSLQLAILITFYVGLCKTTAATTMNKQKSGKWGLDIDATLGVIIQFVCGSRALTSSQLPGKGCTVGTCWFNWKNRHGETGGQANNLIISQQPGAFWDMGLHPWVRLRICGKVAWKSALWLHTHLTKQARVCPWACRQRRGAESCSFLSEQFVKMEQRQRQAFILLPCVHHSNGFEMKQSRCDWSGVNLRGFTKIWHFMQSTFFFFS